MFDAHKALQHHSKEELIELLEMMGKNIVAMDGVWFQACEKFDDMDRAMECDKDAWKNYSPAEAKRLKRWLGLGEHPGIEGLEQAMKYRSGTLANPCVSMERVDDHELIYKIVMCRIQDARKRKNMPFHPCKYAAIYEHACFASAIDDRIQTECLSCYPEITDESCCCSWRFWIPEL